MGINVIGNPFNQPGIYGTGGVENSKNLEGKVPEDNLHGNMVVTEARERVSFAVATPQLADAMNLTFDERQEYLQAVEEKAASATLNLGGKSVMLDIYAVMEMIREMGQKLRNAMREMRQCENQAIQKNLKSQAAMQREAAWCQMIGGAVVGGLQAGLSLAGSIMQIKSLGAQTDVSKSLGADVASKQLDMAKAGGDVNLAQKQLDEIKGNAPAGIDTNEPLLKTDTSMPADVKVAREKISSLQQDIATLQAKKGGLEDAVATGKLSGSELASCKEQISKLSEASKSKGAELDQAVADYNKLAEIEPSLANEQTDKFKNTIAADREELAKAVVERDECAKRLDELKNSPEPADPMQKEIRAKVLEKREGELSSASQRVSDAREKLGNDYQEGSIVAEYDASTEKGQAKIHESMLAEVDGYKKEYEAALERSNNEKRVNGMESDQAKTERREARYRYNLARAEQVYNSSTLGKLKPDAHQKVVGQLTNELTDLNSRVTAGVRAGGSEKTAAFGMLWQGMASSFGGIGQKVVEGIGQLKQAEITEKQADEKMLEEQLDQLKDLFAQDQALIQKALELFQSVISKESQSLEEIINALKA